MKSDLTHLVLINPTWLLAGLLIYFILSLFKVHIIWDIQPKIYNNPIGDNIFKDYFTTFFRSLFKGTRLIKATFKFLFRYKEQDFLLLKDEQAKPIKKRLNILDGFTTFLKPYLIFAFIWTVLEYWISRKLMYSESKIAFGEIQRLLTFIEGIPFVKLLQSNKGLIFLFYGMICVLIPVLYDREDSTKKFKKYFSRTLIYLSLLANISFFGAQTGKTTGDKSKELSELQTEITAIHDSIYKELVVGIQLNDLRDSLKYEDSLYKEEINRFDSLTRTSDNLQIDSTLKVDLQAELAKHHAEIESNSTVENSSVVDNDPKPNGGPKSPSSFFSSYYNTNFKSSSSYSNYSEYMGNQSLWNKETGETILGEVKNIVKEEATVTTIFDKKLEKILGYLFDYGFDATVNEVFSDFDIEAHKTLKKVVSTILSENYKKTIIDKTINILNSIKTNYKKAKEVFAGKAKPYRSSMSNVNNSKDVNTEFYSTQKMIAENKQLQKDIKTKIKSLDIKIPEKTEIVERLKNRALYDGVFIENEKDAVDYVKSQGFDCESEIDFKDAIINKERQEYSKLFLSYENESNIKEYNSFLQKNNRLLANQTSNLTLKNTFNLTKFIGECKGTSATICIRCGLPCAFPICLARRK